MMTREQAERAVQEKLAAARQLLIEVGTIAEDNLLPHGIEFAGLKLEQQFGWFRGDELEIASEWNTSHCVIGSKLAEGESRTDWQSSSWCLE